MILKGGVWVSVGYLWLLVPWCWQPFLVGYYCLFLFLYLYLLYFSSLWISLVYAMMILNMIMHTTGTTVGGGGGG